MEESIKKAVDWWVDQIKKSQSPAYLEDSRPEGLLGAFMALNSMNNQSKVSEAEIVQFRTSLEKIIREGLSNVVNDNSFVLSTDYFPEYPLSIACLEAKLSSSVFPTKTVMWICTNRVSVRLNLGQIIEL